MHVKLSQWSSKALLTWLGRGGKRANSSPRMTSLLLSHGCGDVGWLLTLSSLVPVALLLAFGASVSLAGETPCSHLLQCPLL